MLSAAGALRWFRDTLAPGASFEELVAEAEEWPAGAEGLTFLPYLAGERTPHADPSARAMFEGLSLRHGRGGLVRAVLEGVAYGLRDSLELLRGLGVDAQVGRASGGGARSRLWLEIVASVLGVPLELTEVEEGSAYGAALLAGVSNGVFANAEEAVAACVRVRDRIEPNEAWSRRVRRGLCSLPRALSGRQISGGTMSYEPVRWGIVSTADINRLVIPPAQASPKVDLVAVASRTQERADAYAAEWGIPARVTARTRRCSPTRRSRPSTSRCRTRCTASGRSAPRRPASTCSARSRWTASRIEVDEAFDAADAAGTLLTEAFMWRHNPQTLRLRELLDEGAIGELRVVRSCFSYGLYDDDNIRLRTDVEGGALMDVGCYCVSGSRFVAGEEPELRLRAAVDRAERDGLGLHGLAPLPGRRAGALRLRHGASEPRRAGGDRQRGLAVPRRSLARARAGHRAASRRTASSGSRSSPRTRTASSSRT